jgi:outer membrane immunogenic protein
MRLLASAAVLAFLLGGTAASAADLSGPMPFDWSGFYVGVQGGLDLTQPNEVAPTALPGSATEVSGGINAQTLYQTDSVVFGAILDGNIATPIASQSCPVTTRTCQAGSGGDFSLRGKLGYAQDNFLLYGTGGWGWADYQAKSYVTADGSALTADQRLLNGWVAGAGVSYAINSNWIANVEYLHYDLGSGTSYTTAGGETIAPTINSLTLGVGYKF